jgi:hypothetical protein
MVKTTLVEAVSPRRLRNTSYHRAPGAADRLAENQLVAPRAARGMLLKKRLFSGSLWKVANKGGVRYMRLVTSVKV